jgi:hypothetical protein
LNLKISAVLLAALACASCATADLQPLSISRQPTQRGHVNKWTTRVAHGSLAGDLMVSDFYYQRRPQPVTPALLREMDARARIAGCTSGAPPRRDDVSAKWSSYDESYRIIAWYRCS